MKVENVKILDLMSVLIVQMQEGIKYIDMEVVDKDTVRISATEPPKPKDNTNYIA